MVRAGHDDLELRNVHVALTEVDSNSIHLGERVLATVELDTMAGFQPRTLQVVTLQHHPHERNRRENRQCQHTKQHDGVDEAATVPLRVGRQRAHLECDDEGEHSNARDSQKERVKNLVPLVKHRAHPFVVEYGADNYIIAQNMIIINAPTSPSRGKIQVMDTTKATQALTDAQKIVVIQAENPDGDSLGSALALEELLSEAGKDVTLYCAIDIPKYLRYIKGWDRVEKDWPTDREVAIIVDTSSKALLEQTLATPGVYHFLESHPVIVFDHHLDTEGDLPFETIPVVDAEAVATSEVIYEFAQTMSWAIPPQAAENMFASLQADSLGLTTQNTTAKSYQTAADLVKLGAVPADIEGRRREYMKKPADILAYKGQLISRIEYDLDGRLATVHIPWDEIEEYSDRYNPSVLVLDEMRLVDTVDVAVALKTYPDGKITGKIRANIPVAEDIAGYFGGGGHGYAAGFKLFETYDTIRSELLTAVDKAITTYEASIS